METIKTIYLGDLRTEVTHVQSGTKIITDAPTDNKGKGQSFSPTDMLAASYASCSLTIMGIASKLHGFDIDGTEVKTTKVMGTGPRRIVELIIEFNFPHNNYTDKERKIIESSIKECPAANSLLTDIKITRTMNFEK